MAARPEPGKPEKEVVTLPREFTTGEMVNINWIIEKKLGNKKITKNDDTITYIAAYRDTYQKAALKVSKLNPEGIYIEAKILKTMSLSPLFGTLFELRKATEYNEFNVLAMKLEGPSIAYLLSVHKKFSSSTMLIVTNQMRQAIEALHQLGYAHGHICPNSFVLSADSRHVKIVNLDKARRFNPSEEPETEPAAKSGFAPPARQISRKGAEIKVFEKKLHDDLYAFMCMMLVAGTKYTWRKFEHKGHLRDLRRGEFLSLITSQLPKEFSGIPAALEKFKYTETAIYTLLSSSFEDVMHRKKIKPNTRLDWEAPMRDEPNTSAATTSKQESPTKTKGVVKKSPQLHKKCASPEKSLHKKHWKDTKIQHTGTKVPFAAVSKISTNSSSGDLRRMVTTGAVFRPDEDLFREVKLSHTCPLKLATDESFTRYSTTEITPLKSTTSLIATESATISTHSTPSKDTAQALDSEDEAVEELRKTLENTHLKGSKSEQIKADGESPKRASERKVTWAPTKVAYSSCNVRRKLSDAVQNAKEKLFTLHFPNEQLQPTFVAYCPHMREELQALAERGDQGAEHEHQSAEHGGQSTKRGGQTAKRGSQRAKRGGQSAEHGSQSAEHEHQIAEHGDQSIDQVKIEETFEEQQEIIGELLSSVVDKVVEACEGADKKDEGDTEHFNLM